MCTGVFRFPHPTCISWTMIGFQITWFFNANLWLLDYSLSYIQKGVLVFPSLQIINCIYYLYVRESYVPPQMCKHQLLCCIYVYVFMLWHYFLLFPFFQETCQHKLESAWGRVPSFKHIAIQSSCQSKSVFLKCLHLCTYWADYIFLLSTFNGSSPSFLVPRNKRLFFVVSPDTGFFSKEFQNIYAIFSYN